MDSVEDYTRKWAKQEEVKLNTVTHSGKKIGKLSRSMGSKVRSMFNNKGVVDNLTDLHTKYVVVPADKASSNIVFVCKTYYIECLHSVVKAGLLISIHDMVIYSNSAIYRSKYELKSRRLNYLNRHFKTTCKYLIGNP